MSITVPTKDEFDALAARVTKLEGAAPKPTPAPTPAPTPSPVIAPPPQAIQAKFTKLLLGDEFDKTPDIGFGDTGHRWNAGLWYEPVMQRASFRWDGKSVLTLDASAGSVDISTMFHDTSGGQFFQYGYFETMLRCTNWSGPWLFSVGHARGQGGRCSEIDIQESDNSTPTQAHQTLHYDTGGQDRWNQGKGDNAWNPSEIGSCLGVWRKYGCLWTPSEVTFFVDDAKTTTMPPYDSTNQPMFLILDLWRGSLLPGTPEKAPLTLDIDWVRCWGG
jgi:hypothetical protein